MRRTKADMLLTRQQILEAGLDCFSEKGFEASSLVEIASRAGVTRGAIYWHFENKIDLYRSVIEYALEKGNITSYFNDVPLEHSFEQRMNEVFWRAFGENKFVDFIFKTMAYIYGREEFQDMYDKLVNVKRSLYDTLRIEISVFVRVNNLMYVDIERVTRFTYIYFEGMFLTKNIPIGLEITRQEVEEFTKYVIKNITMSNYDR